MKRHWEVLMGFETAEHCYTALCVLRAEADWLAVMDAEERVRFVFKLADGHAVQVVRLRELSMEEAWDMLFTRGPVVSKMKKSDLAEMAAVSTGLTGFQED